LPSHDAQDRRLAIAKRLERAVSTLNKVKKLLKAPDPAHYSAMSAFLQNQQHRAHRTIGPGELTAEKLWVEWRSENSW